MHTYWTIIGTLILLAYVLVANSLRFRRMQKQNTYFSSLYPDSASLGGMTNTHAHEILKYLQQYEFPFAFECSLAASLYRPYGIPSISRVLAKTKQFSNVSLASKRTADTAVLVVDFCQNPPESEKCCAAISRMNFIHAGYQNAGLIGNDDLLYTLSLLACLPVRFIERFEWRPLTKIELCAAGVFWMSLGAAMNLSYAALASGVADDGRKKSRSSGTWKDGLQFLQELADWSENYETQFMVAHPLNHKAAVETESILLYGVPERLRGLGRAVLTSMMDERLRRALILPNPPKILETAVFGILHLRKFFLRHLCLPRFKPHLRVTQHPNASGRFHRITWAAQPWYVRPSFRKRWRWQAWREWVAGRPLPGDANVAPEGYKVENVGPAKFEGKGVEEVREEKERLMRKGRGGCPFGG